MDAGPVAATDVPLASVVNGSAADHPDDGTTVHLSDSLVALTPRLVAPSGTACNSSIWVGTVAGGDFSGIQVFESFTPTGSNTCFNETAHLLPQTIAIGDTITNVTGRYINFCPSGSSCPPFTAQEMMVGSSIAGSMFAVGAHGTAPTATTVAIGDIAGAGLTFGDRSLALQGAVVTIENVEIATDGVPSDANHDVMTVVATGTTTPSIQIQISKYPGVGCQRTTLEAATAGFAVGDITGVLQYSFGNWTIQPRGSSDFSNASLCTMDGGVADVDAGT
jgi:hypothetical protein